MGLAWNSRVTRFSRSRELEAKRNVRPLMFVSTRPEGAMVELLLTLYILGTARCWRSMNVKLKLSSSSLGRRMRNEGVPSLAAAGSGSWEGRLAWGREGG